MRRYVVNASRKHTRNEAERIRETFMDRPVERVDYVNWKWPKKLREVGQCMAVMYSSDKWKKKGQLEDYKHVSEGEQRLYVRDGFLRDADADPSGRKKLQACGPMVEVNGELPNAFAVLAPLLGLQARLYDCTSEEEGQFGDDYYQIDVTGATLGAAKHPETGETFLIVYTPKQVLAMITGDVLDVKRDGIVG